MKNSFGNAYSTLYDLLYKTKDYEKENGFIFSLLPEKNISTILDLGCGTGGHDLLLAQQGYQVMGVDLSEGMIRQAIQKSQAAGLAAEYRLGDIRTFQADQKFDLVISMFAVMSYQVSNADFLSALSTARAHLNVESHFVFDAWFGPAVLTQTPETRVKELQIEGDRLLRIAEPEIDTLQNKVIVHYKLLRLRGSQLVEETHEAHPMRYFFAPEVESFAGQAGFEVVKVCPFMEASRKPEINDWNVTWVLKAI
jgi:2-polyprenyl-3-methyl-5-hydroxy-6-metoxy-1,4-benzoquinol methylase